MSVGLVRSGLKGGEPPVMYWLEVSICRTGDRTDGEQTHFANRQAVSDTNDVLNIKVRFSYISINTGWFTLVVDTVVDSDNIKCLVRKPISLFK